MVGSDPISDMLTRVRNASNVGKATTTMPFSKLKLRVAEKIKEAGFIADVQSKGEGISKNLVITINQEGQMPIFNEIKRVSKPGRRVYAPASDIPRVKNGRGVMIVSTSSGVMTDTEARKANVGGELICSVY